MTARSSEMERGVADAVWAFSSSFRKPVPSRRRPFTALQSALQPCSKGFRPSPVPGLIKVMVCFYIAVNSESAACTAPPEKRGVLQLVSLLIQVGNIDPGGKYCEQAPLVQVVIWVTAIVGLVLVSDSGFVELQLILNGLTGKNGKIFSFLKFFLSSRK